MVGDAASSAVRRERRDDAYTLTHTDKWPGVRAERAASPAGDCRGLTVSFYLEPGAVISSVRPCLHTSARFAGLLSRVCAREFADFRAGECAYFFERCVS